MEIKLESKKTSNVVEVLKVLSTARKGMTANAIFHKIDRYDCAHTLRVVLTQLTEKGLIYNDGRMECGECGTATLCFRITDQGRIHLERKK